MIDQPNNPKMGFIAEDRSQRSSSHYESPEEILTGEHKKLVRHETPSEKKIVMQNNDTARNSNGYGFVEDYSVWARCNIPLFKDKCNLKLEFNPIVSSLALGLIWFFILWCCIAQEDVPFDEWRKILSKNFTWMYIGLVNVVVIFAVGLLFGKYSKIKLGSPDDEPEYNSFTWFMMLFSCGVGVGLFFYGVAEPIYHYTTENRYSADSTLPDNELAQIAIVLNMHHWGIHGWAIFSLVGLLLSLMSYREKLPLTMKSCFYPLIGNGIFGWIGDFIDVFSIIATLFGVCTSLGLGARQVATGLAVLSDRFDADSISLQVALIWWITAMATISTVSGLNTGIRRLSEISFGMGLFIMLCVFCLDQTEYLLNLFIQSLGYYFQNFLQLGWHTDAFEQLGPAHGSQDRNRLIPANHEQPDGPSDWIHTWTLFYWGWWISFTPFCAMFLAKISKGRTIKEYVLGTILAPSLYCFVWPILYGGVALRLERDSSELGLCCRDTFGWFDDTISISESIAERGIENDIINSQDSASWICFGSCGDCASKIIANKEMANETYKMFLDEYNAFGNDFGSVLADRSLSRLSCHSIEQMWFDVMRSYHGIGEFLSAFSLVSIIFYFVTSSDSGSLVIDCLSANGIPEPPPAQRVFWALMEGTTATALLVAGGKNSLIAIRTIGIVSALPYSFIILMTLFSLWKALKVATGTIDPNGATFSIGLIDPIAGQPFKTMKLDRILTLVGGVLFNIPFAPFTVAKVGTKVYKSLRTRKYYYLYLFLLVSLLIVSMIMVVLGVFIEGVWVIGLSSYLLFCGCVALMRTKTRDMLKIEGSIIEDLMASVMIYPSVVVQLDMTTEGLHYEEDENQQVDL